MKTLKLQTEVRRLALPANYRCSLVGSKVAANSSVEYPSLG